MSEYYKILRSDFIADIVASEIQEVYITYLSEETGLEDTEEDHQKILESCETLLKYFMIPDEFEDFMWSTKEEQKVAQG